MLSLRPITCQYIFWTLTFLLYAIYAKKAIRTSSLIKLEQNPFNRIYFDGFAPIPQHASHPHLLFLKLLPWLRRGFAGNYPGRYRSAPQRHPPSLWSIPQKVQTTPAAKLRPAPWYLHIYHHTDFSYIVQSPSWECPSVLPGLCTRLLGTGDRVEIQLPVHIFMGSRAAIAVSPAFQIKYHAAVAVPRYGRGRCFGSASGPPLFRRNYPPSGSYSRHSGISPTVARDSGRRILPDDHQ